MSAPRHPCGTAKRRQLVLESTATLGGGDALNGIDFVELRDSTAPPNLAQRQLDVTFLKADGLAALQVKNFAVVGGTRITGIKVRAVSPTSDPKRLRLTLNAAGDFSPYELHIQDADDPHKPYHNMDARLSCVVFGFKAECPSDFDCAAPDAAARARTDGPPTDYLTRDWAGFRQLMLDRMSVTMPGWQERNPADLGVTLVEVMADAADKVSWFQDAIGTEAFFEKSRYRQSLVRHARLLGYRPSEGQNARTAVAITVDQNRLGPDVAVPKGTRFLTGVEGAKFASAAVLSRDPEQFEACLNAGAQVFEAMESRAHLHHAQNAMVLHDWGDEGTCLPKGATDAYVVGDPLALGLAMGDLVVLQENIPIGGSKDDPGDITHRQLVRLSSPPQPHVDPVFGLALTYITWHAEDALGFALPLGTAGGLPMSIVRGNLIMVDEGRTVDHALKGGFAREDAIATGPQTQNGLRADDGPGTAMRFRLNASKVVRAPAYEPQAARSQSARMALSPQHTPVAAVQLSGDGEEWSSVPDLMGSDRFAPHICIEPGTEPGAAYVRFGDGVLGRAPSATREKFSARIRHGGGARGNIGAEALAHMVSENATGIVGVSNPIAASGGADMQSRRAVHIAAPQSFRTPKRAVTVEDYAQVAAQHPSVARAYGRRRWTGSWYTITLAVDLVGGGAVDQRFEDDLRDFIESHRLAGHDLNIVTPVFVPLDLVFFVCAKPDAYTADVTRALLETFSDRPLSNGALGLFHPDVLDFGGDVALSPLIARAMAVPGVAWIGTRDSAGAPVGRFGRMDRPGLDYTDAAAIPIAAGEIARLDNDPSRREMGRIRFVTEGGR